MSCELEVEGEDRTTETDTDGFRGTLQLSHQATFFGRANSVTFGFAYDGNDTDFTSGSGRGGAVSARAWPAAPGP